MFKFFGKKLSRGLTGIVAGNTGTAVACIERPDREHPMLQSFNFSATENPDAELLDGLSELALGDQPCTTLLSTGDYQLLVVDAPEVPPEEMAAAIRWRIQELIDFHIDDAVLDIFDAPPSGPANSTQLYVVVARTDTIRQRIDAFEEAGINLETIDIPELAMRNLAACLPEDEAGLVSLYFAEDQCLITITHNETLYLTRSIDIGYRQLQQEASNPQSLCNRLALEIQRSMDYYEHNYHQAPVKSIVILPVPVMLYGLTDALQLTLGLEARMINVTDILECEANPDDENAADCLLAVSSAPRVEPVTL